MKNIVNIFVLSFLLIPALVHSQPVITVDKRTDKFERISVESLTELPESSIKSLKIGQDIQGDYEMMHYDNRYYLFLIDQFKVLVLSNDLKIEHKMGGKGKGPGVGSYIHSYAINKNDDTIILYDSNFRKLVNYNLDGSINFEYIIKNQGVPYYISDLYYVKENQFLATGISSTEWNKLNYNKIYKNVYLLNIRKNGITKIDETSVIPDHIKTGIKQNYIISSNITNPFKITEINKRPCIYNISSPVISCLEIKNDKIDISTKFKLADSYFKQHNQMREFEFIQSNKNSSSWMASGNFMINIFDTGNNLIFYTSKFEENSKKTRYSIIIAEKPEMNIRKVINYSSRNIVYDVNKNEIISLFYNEHVNNNKGGYSLLRLPVSFNY